MVRSYSYGAPLLLVGGLVTSVVLVPDSRELATLLYQAGRYAEAEPVFAERYHAGEGEVDVLGPLVRMQLAKGDSERALSLLEAYERTHPGDDRLWNQALDRDAGTLPPSEQVRLLRAMSDRNPSVQVYEQLAALYQALGQDADEVEVLSRLIELEPRRLNARERLIRLETEAGNFVAAGHAVDQLFAQFPAERSAALEEERMRLYLRAGQAVPAEAWAQARIAEDLTTAPRYAALFLSGGATGDLANALADDPQPSQSAPSWVVDTVLGHAWQAGREDLLPELLVRMPDSDPAFELVRAASRMGTSAGSGDFTNTSAVEDGVTAHWRRLWVAYLTLRAGRVEQAAAAIDGLTVMDSVSVRRFASLAPSVLKSGHLEQGLELFARLNERFPAEAFTEAHSVLADALARQLAEAEATARAEQEVKALARARAEAQARAKKDAEAKAQSEALAREQVEAERLAQASMSRPSATRIDSAREAELRSLAGGEGPDGRHLAELMTLWGRSGSSGNLDWIEAQARKAPANQRAGWWNRLIDLGGARRVLGLITREYYQLDAEQEAALMRAYEAVRIDVARDRQLLSQSWSLQDVGRLEHLALVARQEGRERAEAGIWQRVLMLQPDHPEALRRLGRGAR